MTLHTKRNTLIFTSTIYEQKWYYCIFIPYLYIDNHVIMVLLLGVARTLHGDFWHLLVSP